MSEFDKIQNILHRTNPSVNTAINSVSAYSRITKCLLSGTSRWQQVLVESFVANQNIGKIILTKESANSVYHSLVNRTDTIVIRNSPSSKAYHPFSGHNDVEIAQMLKKLSNQGTRDADLNNLIRHFSKLFTLDSNLIEAISNNIEGLTLELIEERLEILVRRNIVSEREAEQRMGVFRSYVSSFSTLEDMLADLIEFSRVSNLSLGFRTSYSVNTALANRKNLVFVFDGDLNSASGYDKTLLTLLSSDIELSQSIKTIPFALIIDDVSYLYIKPFQALLDRGNVFVVLNLETETDYSVNKVYGQLITTKFERYMIFRHTNDTARNYWSNFFGGARVIEYNYSNSNTAITKYPMFSTLTGLFGTEQHSDVVGFHYVDRNIFQEYDIRNLHEKEYLLFEKNSNQISQQTLNV